MRVGDNPTGDDRRDPDHDMQQHVAAVWAAPIADLDEVGLFRLGTACLDLAVATPDPERCALLSAVALPLLVHAGRKDELISEHIARLCEREQAAVQPRPEIAHVIAALEEQLRAS